jgi:hypothetical protein
MHQYKIEDFYGVYKNTRTGELVEVVNIFPSQPNSLGCIGHRHRIYVKPFGNVTPTGLIALEESEFSRWYVKQSGVGFTAPAELSKPKEIPAGTLVFRADDITEQQLQEFAQQLNSVHSAFMCTPATDSIESKHVARTLSVLDIAKLCHETNRAYCQSIGDFTQLPWHNCPQWQKDSAVNGVRFHLENETTPEASHINWLKQKEAEGWVYGEVKDPEKKTHPCMRPYAELSQEQRSKDYIFKAICDYFKAVVIILPKHTKELSFNQALEYLKHNHRVARSGWNGKGLSVHLERGRQYGDIKLSDCFLINAERGSYNTWVPSISDLLAEDWYLVE